MDKQKFIGVLEKVEAKLSEHVVGVLPLVQATMLERVKLLHAAILSANGDEEVVNAINVHFASIIAGHGSPPVDPILIELRKDTDAVVTEGFALIKKYPSQLYAIIKSCLFKISTAVLKYKNKNEAAKEKYVR
jgi:hypothetical protein